MSGDKPEISLIIPIYNEAANIDDLMGRCFSVLRGLGRTFEIVAVDDGSSDGSLELLLKHHEADKRLRIVRLLRNFGQTPAIYAGMAHSRGDIVVMLDADLQNPPEEVNKLLEKIEEGYDVVQGWREDRRDSMFRTIPSRLLNRFVSWAVKSPVRDLGCGLKAFRRETVQRMNLFQHKARYLPAEIFWLGVNIAEVKVRHEERRRGASKYNIFSLGRLAFDIVTGLSTAPVRVVTFLGWGMLFGGLVSVSAVLGGYLVGRPAGTAGVVCSVVLLLSGVQMLGIAVVSEYASRTYTEVQARPYYLVKEVIE